MPSLTDSVFFFLSFREKWYNYPFNSTINLSDQLSKSMHLDLTCHSLDMDNVDYLCVDIRLVMTVAQVYHLTTPEDVDFDALAKILVLLPTLDSLQLDSLSLPERGKLSDDERSALPTIPSTNRITKVYLVTMNNIEEVYFLMEHCPQLMYLKVNCIKNMDVKIFLRLILMKMKIQMQYQLRLLSFHIPRADDYMIKQAKKMIDDEHLLTGYSIKRIGDEIFLQWIV